MTTSRAAVSAPLPRRPGTTAAAQMGLGIGSLCVGIISCLLGFIPCVGMFISIPLAIIGLILGVVGLILALTNKNKGLGMPIAGAAVNGLAILIVVVMWTVVFAWLGVTTNQAVNTAIDQAKKMQEDAERRKREAEQKTQEERRKSQDNLRQLALAMQSYHATYKRFPSANKNGLSWRVELLPYLEQIELYQRFRLNEPWNSQNNFPLRNQMPEVYKPVRKGIGNTHTFYQVFAGKDGLFRADRDVRMPLSFPLGTSNTFLIVEGDQTVEWTSPNDIYYDQQRLVPRFGQMFDNGFNVALADTDVRWFDRNALN